ncbi:single-stranded DNA-binding protein [Oenococcus kitaharae]|uniref:Single-stranded DNA-binding protein n=1 Tax=Oenococcus kitaharae DSM 17330 TaxID=1045004 RepID=G9WF10_9LACO|nr:single-stranded DNA-binding protein [Oenococcus kitaharae]EHN58570.1 Single-stranded DNA-binding protein [Oenococcus kitaharae DSM 17330]MCV3296203.1 single-stranded DNA-binding protein [Oenococcus kitaharae]OEY84716.1 single-stranded DNA-binding protein [Oenococcus kitaharae]OEY85000.1 single-stranded DNA-binding protein [Oenococcus kitaharae]OEY85790.1 single-stranded DNA-binding protein [Oenococcus kitaharae]
MINRVVLVGRLTRDVELRYTGSGDAVGSFTIAVERNFTNRAGEREADFISCVIWRKPAENFANFTGKGAMIAVEGRLQTRSYDNNQGQKVYVTEVVVDNFQLLETRAQSEARRSQNGSSAAPQQNQNNFKIPAQQSNPFDAQFNNQSQSSSANNDQSSASSPFDTDAGNNSVDISDDDLPF